MIQKKLGKRSAEAAEETRLHILKTAEALFCEHGYDRVSIRNISEKAGVSHSLIRHHFGNKEKIWRHVHATLDDYFQNFIEEVLLSLPANTPPLLKIYRLFATIVAHSLIYPRPAQFIADVLRRQSDRTDYFIKYDDNTTRFAQRNSESA